LAQTGRKMRRLQAKCSVVWCLALSNDQSKKTISVSAPALFAQHEAYGPETAS